MMDQVSLGFFEKIQIQIIAVCGLIKALWPLIWPYAAIIGLVISFRILAYI